MMCRSDVVVVELNMSGEDLDMEKVVYTNRSQLQQKGERTEVIIYNLSREWTLDEKTAARTFQTIANFIELGEKGDISNSKYKGFSVYWGKVGRLFDW